MGLTTGTYRVTRRGRRALGALAITLLAGLSAAPLPAQAALETVLQDDAQLLHRPEEQLRRSLEELKLLGVDRIRVTAGWSVLTRHADQHARPAFDATDPSAYEHERWRNLDRLLVLAREYGFQTMVDIAFWAPKWASRDKPGERGRTNVDTGDFSRFAVAVARRYSGTYIIPRPVGSAQSGTVIKPSEDEQYLASNYGEQNSNSSTGLHEELGVGWLGGPTDRAVADALGTPTTAATAPLPKVEVFTIWNEPNHTAFLRPQWRKAGRAWVPHSPHVYREMVVRSYPAIKAVRPDATILVGATSVTGSYRRNGTGNVPPLRFLREMACVNRKLRPLRRSGCRHFKTLPADGYSHHPYSLRTVPDARNQLNRPDDAPMAELPRLAALLDRLIRKGRIASGARTIWLTEYGYETNPPDPTETFTPGDQAKFLTWAEYLASRVPTVRTFPQFLLRDLPPSAFRVGSSKKRPFGQWQSGLTFEDGRPKLAAYSFRAGLFVQRLTGGRLRIFGRLRLGPGARTVVLERRPAKTQAWETISTLAPGVKGAAVSFTADGRDSFTRFAKAPPRSSYRFRLRYLDGQTWRTSPSVAAVER